MRRLGVLMVGLVLLAGCGTAAKAAAPKGPIMHTIRGTMTLQATSQLQGSGCHGTGGYNDLTAGAAVTVTNQSQTIIGATQLAPGLLQTNNWCVFPFKVTVPSATFYGIEISHRGSVTFSAAQMRGLQWKPALSIGGSS